MSPDVWLQIALTGLTVGGVYALAAVGLALLFQVTEIINIAHGDLVILGSYLTLLVSSSLGLDPLVSMVPVMGIMFMFGIVLQQTAFRKVIGRRVRAETTLLVSFGVLLVLENGMARTFTVTTRYINAAYASASAFVQIGPARIPFINGIAAVIAALLMILLHEYLSRSYVGRAMRAIGQNVNAARIVGIPTNRIYLLTFGLSAALAGAAGTLFGMMFSFDPYSGFLLGFKAFVIILLGGFRSLRGILIAGLMLGEVESIASLVLPSLYTSAVAFVFLIVALLYRRQGALQ